MIEVAAALSCDVSTVWRMHAAMRMPAPIHMGQRMTRWKRTEIEAWIDAGCPDRRAWEQRTK